jgi:glycosyltransferase involved in cell wall biosynthesis
LKVLMPNAFYYERGGCEVYTFALSKELAEHGHEVVPFSMSDERNFPSEYEEYFVDNIDFSEVSADLNFSRRIKAAIRVLYSNEAKRKIRRLIERTDPDLAHVHNIAHHLSPSILVGIKQFGLPIVQTLHDYKLICPSTLLFCGGRVCERCKYKKYYNAVIHRCKRGSIGASALAALELYVHRVMRIYEDNVDVFIAPSRFLRDKMIEFRMDGRKIVHIPQLIDTAAYAPQYEGRDYLVYYGRLSGEKGLHTLVDALRLLRNAKLYIAGEGPLKSDLESRAADVKGIRFLGYVEHEKLKELVRNAMFVVVPSECYENAPMSVYEASALGKPVVGSRIGGIPELIEDGVTGLLFEPGNAEDLAGKIEHLLGNRSLIPQMGESARDRLERRHGKGRHYEAITNVYESLL